MFLRKTGKDLRWEAVRAVLQSAELKDSHHQLVLLSTLTPGLEDAINLIRWFFNLFTFKKMLILQTNFALIALMCSFIVPLLSIFSKCT